MKIFLKFLLYNCIFLKGLSVQVREEYRNGMISGTSGKLAVEHGLNILKKGGSAMDAAITTALSQIVLCAGSWVSFAGIFNMVYYEASTNKIYDFNGNYNTLENELDPLSIPKADHQPTPKGRTVLVPGFMASIEKAHELYGKLQFEELFEPAIGLAENGIEWTETLSYLFKQRTEILTRLNETKEIFTKEDGTFYQNGDIFKQSKLAETLRKVSQQGSKYMYEGEWASKFIETVQREGGKITMDDLKKYTPIIGDPLKWDSSLKNYSMFVHGIESNGGPDLIQALNLLESSDINASAVNYMNSSEVLSDVISILNLVEMKYFDLKEAKNFLLDNKSNILSKDFAKTIWTDLKQGKFDQKNNPIVNLISFPKHSDAIIVFDSQGNIAALTHSINTEIWGETGIFIDGVSIPDSASFQQYSILKAGPGNRLPDPLCPGIIFKDNKPYMGFSSIGNGLFEQSFISLMSVLDFNATPQEAIDQPYIGYINLDKDGKKFRTLEPNKFSVELINELKEKGVNIEENSLHRGYFNAIMRNLDSGELTGTINSVLGGDALGY